MSTNAQWLSDEDSNCFEDRLSRLEWLTANSPKAEYWTFPGGLHSKSLFEEAQYCFVYAQFLATVLLGLAYIELTLAALLYGAGRSDLERASLSKLLAAASTKGVIGVQEHRELERIRKIRNAYAHFRKPLDKKSLERRAILEDVAPYEVIEQDATTVMSAALRMIALNAI
jgi:hypothetical protein